MDTADPIDGRALFDDVREFLTRFVAYPSPEAADAHALWIGHAWLMDQWDSTPRIAFLSPEPGSGKSRALEVTEPLVPRPVHAVNATPAALFRKVSSPEGLPTILFDEVDTIFGPKAKDNEDLRGMLNAGHRRGATALRAVVRGHSVEVEEFPAYCAVALAGLNDLPDTIASRAVIVRMRRRASGERVEPFRPRLIRDEAAALHARLIEWAGHATVSAWPEMPPGVEDRSADVWEALLAVADLAGGEWPVRARVAAVALVADSREGTGSVGVQLLRDIQSVFDSTNATKLHTRDILSALNDDDELPWGDWGGRPLDARRLSKMLAKYDIRPHDIRAGAGNVNAKGYDYLDFEDAWNRYLTSPDNPHPPTYIVHGGVEG